MDEREVPRPKARGNQGRLRLRRLYHRRRQGRGHGLRRARARAAVYLSARGARPAQFSPEVWTRDEFGYRNLPEFLDIIREVVAPGLVDIMLMSAYVNEQLTIKEGLVPRFARHARGAGQRHHGCLGCPPRLLYGRTRAAVSLRVDHIQCGKIECDRRTAFPGRTWACIPDLRERSGAGPRDTAGIQGISRGSRAQKIPVFSRSLRPERAPRPRPGKSRRIYQ